MHEIQVATTHPVAERSDRRQIVADAGDEPGQQVESRPHRQHEREQQQGQQHVGLTQALDAPVHPGDHRPHRDEA